MGSFGVMTALAAPAFQSASAAGAKVDANTVDETKAAANRKRRVVIMVRPGERRGSGEQIAKHSSFNVGQAAVDAVVADGKAFVVDAQQVEHGGVDVVAGRRTVAVGRFVAPFVAGANGRAAADAAAREPVREHERVVIAPVPTLGTGHAA